MAGGANVYAYVGNHPDSGHDAQGLWESPHWGGDDTWGLLGICGASALNLIWDLSHGQTLSFASLCSLGAACVGALVATLFVGGLAGETGGLSLCLYSCLAAGLTSIAASLISFLCLPDPEPCKQHDIGCIIKKGIVDALTACVAGIASVWPGASSLIRNGLGFLIGFIGGFLSNRGFNECPDIAGPCGAAPL